ncbi:MAG TPA: transposase [Flavobacteriaceae bacterium]|nr:transposase [Flavobacteriaceae bacterium]
MTKFKNKYRIETTRLKNWDYGWNALYFVTICLKNRRYYFGNVVRGKMEFSKIGVMAEKYWLEIPVHFPFVKLHPHIVMPNHVHGIVQIDKPDVEPQNFADLPSATKNKFGPQSKNLASIIRGFKIGVTKNARNINPDFAWQSRYHDHIIRNEKSFQNISNYIQNNPKNWKRDTFHVK